MNNGVVSLCCQTLVAASEGKLFEHEKILVDLFIAGSLTIAALSVYSGVHGTKVAQGAESLPSQVSLSITHHPNPADFNLQATPTEQSSHNDV